MSSFTLCTLDGYLPNKGCSEGPVEDGVYDGVDGGRDVAQPEAEVDDMGWYSAAGTGSKEDVEDEEGGPAEDKGEKDEAEHFGSLLLRRHHIRSHRLPLAPAREEPPT